MNQQSTKKIDHMNYFKLTLLMCWMFSIPLLAQPFITFGGGVSSLFVLSDELDNFTDTYNAYNVVGTAQELNGVGNGAIGYQMEAGFRHYNQFHLAINFGYQRNMIRDGAEFGDQTTRDLKFTFTGIFSELEFGKQIDQYFVNGVLRYAFRRKVEIEATHSARETPLAGSLDGDYVSPTTRSAHAGISLGALKEPFVIGIKVLYPVFIGGDDSFVRSDSPEKQAIGTEIFPSNFEEYATQPNYSGLHSNIDGLILSLSLQFAIPL